MLDSVFVGDEEGSTEVFLNEQTPIGKSEVIKVIFLLIVLLFLTFNSPLHSEEFEKK